MKVAWLPRIRKIILVIFLICNVPIWADVYVESHLIGSSNRTDFIKEMQEEFTPEKCAENFTQMMSREFEWNNVYLEKFFQIAMYNADREDFEVMSLIEESIFNSSNVRHEGVYTSLAFRNLHLEGTIAHIDGWFVLSNYSQSASEKAWFHHMLYFNIQAH